MHILWKGKNNKNFWILLLLLVTGGDFFGDDSVRLAIQMYSSQRAWKVGDLLTVIVDEKTNSSKNESLSTSKETSAEADPAVLKKTGGNTFSSNLIPGYTVSGSSEFSGSGASSSSEALSAQFTVRVIDTFENGVLLIRGDRKVKIRKETVEMVLTGLVRRRDINSNNMINSSKIGDAHIVYETGGISSRSSNPGWFWKLFQILNPF